MPVVFIYLQFFLLFVNIVIFYYFKRINKSKIFRWLFLNYKITKINQKEEEEEKDKEEYMQKNKLYCMEKIIETSIDVDDAGEFNFVSLRFIIIFSL